jgi:hypothetical protein
MGIASSSGIGTLEMRSASVGPSIKASINVDYKGIDDSRGASYCPVVLKPQHAVLEQPRTEDRDLLEKRRWRRRFLGLLTRNSFAPREP